VIEAEGVEKQYGGERVLTVDALRLAHGERVLITGGNGSGKSTLLRLLAGVARPDRGRVRRAVTLDRAALGYVPQSGGLYTELSLEENLALRRRLWGLRVTRPADAWYVRDVGLAPLLGKPAGQLSGGFQRLATVAAALHVEPGWLLLDEPFYGLDADRREVLIRGLAAACRDLQLLVIAGPMLDEFPDPTTIISLESGRVSR
jgi:ABC-type multidrug transport system ATPase subunit